VKWLSEYDPFKLPEGEVATGSNADLSPSARGVKEFKKEVPYSLLPD
jgi:hypothetical protein